MKTLILSILILTIVGCTSLKEKSTICTILKVGPMDTYSCTHEYERYLAL